VPERDGLTTEPTISANEHLDSSTIGVKTMRDIKIIMKYQLSARGMIKVVKITMGIRWVFIRIVNMETKYLNVVKQGAILAASRKGNATLFYIIK